MKKHFYLIVDTETTQANTVADFGAVVVDRQGNIVEQFGVLLDGHFGTVELFHDKKAPAESFWSTMMLHRRKKNYDQLCVFVERENYYSLWIFCKMKHKRKIKLSKEHSY